MICERCGEPAIDVTGREPRRAFFMLAIQKAKDVAQRAAFIRRLREVEQEYPALRCAAHATCGSCFFRDEGLLVCQICSGLACADCALPAMKIEHGKVVEAAPGAVLCVRCNPPNGGRNAPGGRAPVPSGFMVPV